MSKLGSAISFIMGAVIGGTAVWYVTKERYAQLAEEEIHSVKAAYARRDLAKMEKIDTEAGTSSTEENKTPAVTAKVMEKESISEYAKRIQNGAPMKYSRTVVPAKPEIPGEQACPETTGEHPYVISPEEFDEMEDYTPVSLTYFADEVLADEYGVIVSDAEEIIGDALDHFGEYEEDSVFARNDARRCDYEILRDERTYEEFRASLPPNI